MKEPDGFPEFWAIWLPIKRRNDARGLAREAFAKHIKAGADPQDIIDGASWYVRTTPAGYEYVLLSATWLNRGGYEDDCLRERAFQQRQAERSNVVPIRAPKTAFMLKFERDHPAE